MENQNEKSTITFEWHSLLRDLLRNCWLLVLAAMIASMSLYIVSRSVYSPVYTSTATLAVRTRVGSRDAYSNLSTASEMAEIFTHVFTQPSMKELAAADLGRPSFDGTISSAVQGDTNLMTVSVTAEDPESAYQLLSAVLRVYPNVSEAVFTDAVLDVLTMPQLPTGPSNTISTAKRATIMMLAVLLEGGAIVVLSLLRGTVKNEKSFKANVDSALLGTISHGRSPLTLKERLHGKKRAILISDARTELRFCEDYYKIAAKLEFVQKTKGHKVFSVTSVAENEGKSTAVVNVAMALAERGYKVALLDLDVRKPAIYKMLDRQYPVKTELSDVLSGKVPASKMRLYRYRKTGLLLALNKTPHTKATQWINGPASQQFLSWLRGNMDFVLMDTSPISASADAVNLSMISDSTVLIVRTDHAYVEDINDSILTLRSAGVNLAGCILNDVHRPFAMFGQMGAGEEGYYGYHRYGRQGGYSRYGNVFTEEQLPMDDEPEEIRS